jgi:hypothetical protein
MLDLMGIGFGRHRDIYGRESITEEGITVQKRRREERGGLLHEFEDRWMGEIIVTEKRTVALAIGEIRGAADEKSAEIGNRAADGIEELDELRPECRHRGLSIVSQDPHKYNVTETENPFRFNVGVCPLAI